MSSKAKQQKTLIWNDLQSAAYYDISPLLILDGPAGSGKSSVMYQKVFDYLKKYDGSTGLVVRKRADSLATSVVAYFEKHYVNPYPHLVRNVGYQEHFKFTNGSMLIYKGMFDDAARNALKSIGQDGAVDISMMEEATEFTREDFNEIVARTRGLNAPWRQIIMTMNPGSPTHWIYRDLIKNNQVVRRGDDYLITRGHRRMRYWWMAHLNPGADEEYLENMRMTYGHYYQRMYLGKWVQAEGLVYSMFDFNTHVIQDRFVIPPNWKRYRSIDFGFTDPASVTWWAERPSDNALILYREIYTTQHNIDTLAKMINEYSAGEQYVFTVADHDADKRSYLSRPDVGIPTVLAKKDIEIGIQLTASRLMHNHQRDPGLYFFQNTLIHPVDKSLLNAGKPTSLLEEMVVWAYLQNNKGVDIPEDKNNHGMDSMRYMVVMRDGMDIGADVVTAEDIHYWKRQYSHMEILDDDIITEGGIIVL